MAEETGIIIGLALIALLAAVWSHWAWMRGRKTVVWIVIALVILGGGVFYAIAESRTGGYFPGLGEFLVALFLLLCLLPGLVLGMLVAILRRWRAARGQGGQA